MPQSTVCATVCWFTVNLNFRQTNKQASRSIFFVPRTPNYELHKVQCRKFNWLSWSVYVLSGKRGKRGKWKQRTCLFCLGGKGWFSLANCETDDDGDGDGDVNERWTNVVQWIEAWAAAIVLALCCPQCTGHTHTHCSHRLSELDLSPPVSCEWFSTRWKFCR